jgi:glycerate 2-kinase
VDLACPRLPTPRRISDLNVPDVVEVLAQVGDQVSLHPLHVIEVVLDSYVFAPDTLHELYGLLRGGQQIGSVLECVDGLDHDRDARRFCLLCSEAYVFACQSELLFAVRTRDLMPHEHVHPRALERPREIEGDWHVVSEQVLPSGIANEPPVSGRHVSGVEVEERHVEPGVLGGALHRSQLRLVTGPPELDRREACCDRPPATLQERDLLEQDRDVRAELHADPPSATSITQPGAELSDGYNVLVHDDLQKIFSAGLAAADPQRAVRRALILEGDAILAGQKRFEGRRVFVLAAGKAAGPMAKAAEELLGEKVSGGLVVTKDGHDPGPEDFETVFASHPEPDERGVEAARKAQEVAESLEEGDLLLALISGGASALLADPAPPIGLADLKKLTGDLLRSGADIGEINTVRKHVSALKGGGLARLAHPAPTIALLLSDVVGDEPSSIASGLTAPDPTTLRSTRRVLERYEIEPPESVAAHLRDAEETPASEDPIFENVVNCVCGGGRHAAQAAAKEAGELGYAPLLLTTTLTGDALGGASMYAAIVREALASGNPIRPPCAIVSGGEATVTVRGSGTGGPNQEFVLALAVELDGVDGWAAFSADTDGNDGSTDAAGGMVDGRTAQRIKDAGMDPEGALADNDSYAALEAGGALLVTGPTGTNVNDVRVALVSTPE